MSKLDTLLSDPSVSNLAPEGGTFQVEEGVLRFMPSSRVICIRTIDSWCKAFNAFITVFTKVHATAAGPLVQYLESVKSLAAEGSDWYF